MLLTDAEETVVQSRSQTLLTVFRMHAHEMDVPFIRSRLGEKPDQETDELAFFFRHQGSVVEVIEKQPRHRAREIAAIPPPGHDGDDF